MAPIVPDTTLALGFLSVLESPQLGFIGGLLALNASGRPLEFHCTAPVRPNRAQQILYGPTLRPYLCGEQIASALLAKCKASLAVLLVDCADVLAVRPQVQAPVALVVASPSDEALAQLRSGCGNPELAQRVWAHQPLATQPEYSDDLMTIVQMLDGVEVAFDLAEPFRRIRLAIEEAQGLAGDVDPVRSAA